MRSACSICLPDPSSPDCQGCPDLPLAVSPPADRTLTPTAALSTDLLRFEQAVGRAERQLAEAHYEIDRLKPRWGLLDLLAEARRMAGEQWRRAWIAEENYRWMVEHAADQRLDGYRELGDRAACAENARDAALAECERLRARCDGPCDECSDLAASHAIRAVCDALGMDHGGDHDLDAILGRIRDVRTDHD